MSKKSLCCFFIVIVFVMGGLYGCIQDRPDNNYDKMSDSLYASTVNSLVSTDALNRSFAESDIYNSEKEVGVFYFVWHGSHTHNGIYDVTKLQAENPDALWGTDSESLKVAPFNEFYYWGEPLYGYYSSDDPWVIKRHMELFVMSCVDYIALDLTNLLMYEDAINVIIQEIKRLEAQGWNAPKIIPIFGENDASVSNVPKFYEKMYKNSDNDSVWYRDKKSGKPVISIDFAKGTGLSKEIKDFFELRNTLWPFQHKNPEQELDRFDYSWMDWVFPQHITPDTGRINVSVAQHLSYAFSRSVHPLLADNQYNANWGRGWDYKTGQNSLAKSASGLNLENQWATAHSNRDKVNEVFVTGWNEWIAYKLPGTQYYINEPNDCGNVCFVDNCNYEFSRDIEMMKDGYGDNFFLQNMRNIRKFKNTANARYGAGTGTPALDGTFKGGRTYLDISGEVVERNHRATFSQITYTNTTNRNDVVSTEVINDSSYLYIKINTLNDISFDYEKDNNLNILLSVQGLDGAKWNGYNFVVNRTAAKQGMGKSSLEKFSASNKYEFESVATVDSYLNKNTLVVKIPLSALGITNSKNFTVDFKVADNISDPSNIMNYYIDGESAPIGRLNYRYNAGV